MILYRYAVYLVLLRRMVKDPEALEIPMFFGESQHKPYLHGTTTGSGFESGFRTT